MGYEWPLKVDGLERPKDLEILGIALVHLTPKMCQMKISHKIMLDI